MARIPLEASSRASQGQLDSRNLNSVNICLQFYPYVSLLKLGAMFSHPPPMDINPVGRSYFDIGCYMSTFLVLDLARFGGGDLWRGVGAGA